MTIFRPFGRPLRCLLRAFGCLGDSWGRLGARKRNEARGTEFLDPPGVAFWSPLGAPRSPQGTQRLAKGTAKVSQKVEKSS
jgi:hypothetical protein